MNRGLAIGLAILILVLIYYLWQDRGDRQEIVVGSTTLSSHQADRIRILSSSTTQPTIGNYDSLEYLGTAYQVPAGETFNLTEVIATGSTSTQVIVAIGYGDTAVGNSASAPDAAVTVLELALKDDGAVQVLPVYVSIPADKRPWARISGGSGSWPGPVIMKGVESD